MKKLFKSNLISFIITGFIICTISVSAVAFINSTNVKYRKNNTDVSLKSAFDEIYEKADDCYGYKIGDEITVNGEQYYVIADSPATQDYVVALKANPLTVSEVNTYGGVGTENNHVSIYSPNTRGTSYNRNGYGTMSYYTSETCGLINDSLVSSGCKNNYNDSDVKYIVDTWSKDKFQNNELKIVNEYTWSYSSKYQYWTMTPYSSGSVDNIRINDKNQSNNRAVFRSDDWIAVRPVINVYKQYAIKSS